MENQESFPLSNQIEKSIGKSPLRLKNVEKQRAVRVEIIKSGHEPALASPTSTRRTHLQQAQTPQASKE
jgi:hypothetical protein